MKVIIRWHGHSCFEIRSGNKTLVIDPHDGKSIGIAPPSVKADYVLITHDHFDHSAARAVSKLGTKVIREAGEGVEIGPFKAVSFKVAHDPEGGSRRGMVNAYLVEAEGIKLAHLGDIGEVKKIPELEGVDLLMIPVGGYYTLGAKEAKELIDETMPKVAIPMHYKIHGLALPIHPLEDFLKFFEEDQISRVGREVQVSKEDLEGIEGTEIWVFSL